MIVHRRNASSKAFIEQIQASFLQLEHLQCGSLGSKIGLSGIRNRVYETDLQLPNLRTFYSQSLDRPRGFHCPRLTELFVYSELDINERMDEQTKSCIKNLRLLLVWKLLSYPNDFQFSNLESLYLNRPSNSIFLRDFPRLKELHYFFAFAIFFDLPNHLENLFEQRRRLQRNQLRFYFDGFELDDRTGFESLNAYLPYLPPDQDGFLAGIKLNEHVLRLIKDAPPSCKFNLLSSILPMNEKVYDELIDLPKGDPLVESMIKSVTEIIFKQHLSLNFFFLSDRFKYISSVRLSVEMKQSQLDRLPDALPLLVNFTYDPTFFSNHILDFQFISRFKSLQYFYVHYRLISIEELRLIFEKCKFLYLVSFYRPNKASVRIYRPIGEKVFIVDWCSSDFLDFAEAKFTIEELFDYLEASRWLEKIDFLGDILEVEPAPLLLRHLNEDN